MSSRDRGQLDRRDFLLASIAFAAAPWLRLPTAKLGRIGIELYTVRRELAKDPQRTLARVAAIGFREVEFSGYPPGTPQALRKLLDQLGVTAPSSQIPLQSRTADWERSLEQAAILGQRYVVVASIPENQRGSADDWKRIAASFNRAGETALKHGMQFCYHNHDFEFLPLDGIVPYDLLLAETDPRLVRLELDLYWLTKAGKDPLDYFARWPGRFPLVHVKDMDATPQKFFTEVGKGTIDFRRIFRRAKQAGIQHYFYEQDETSGDAFASAKASYDYLRSLTY